MSGPMQPRRASMPSSLLNSGSSLNYSAKSSTTERMTLAKFASVYNREFPTRFVVCKGFYGPNEDLKFSEGDRLKAHSLKQSTIANIEYDNGNLADIQIDSNIPFAILYNPQDSINDAIKGYKYEKVSDLVQLPVLPPVLWSRKAYQGSSPDTSVSANELLIVRGVKSRLVGRQQLKVYSLTQKKEKTLYTTCVGNFSTKPRDIALFLSDILKYLPDIFPCRAIMFNPEVARIPGVAPPPLMQMGPSIVTMRHSSINTTLVVSSDLRQSFMTSKSMFLDVPISLGILVKKDVSSTDNAPGMISNTKASYDHELLPNSSSDNPISQNCSQFYTNIHFGQDVARESQTQFLTPESAIESGHYQTPCFKERTSSDPIDIGSPARDPPTNYVLLGKNEDNREAKGSGSWGKTSPGSSGDSLSPAWRPQLPPPNKTRSFHRSPGYSYVDTDPTRSTHVVPEGQRVQARGSSDSGIVMASPQSDLAHSMNSLGSSGSGGAIVERRLSNGSKVHRHPGSGDGIVERTMRTSSISSTGYSYAKTNLSSSPATKATPTEVVSPNHYSHLRSHSGPPVVPQLPLLSAQVMQQQRPLATTQQDSAVRRQSSMPVKMSQEPCKQDSTSFLVKEEEHNEEPDSLTATLDQLTKFAQEIEGLNFDVPANEEATQPQPQQQAQIPSGTSPPTQAPTSFPQDKIEKHRNYLRTLDVYQVTRLLEMMGLEQYTPIFQQEQINGDILSTCDDDLLREELKIPSRLHRTRLLRIIEGTYSTQDIMEGKDGYVVMHAAGKN